MAGSVKRRPLIRRVRALIHRLVPKRRAPEEPLEHWEAVWSRNSAVPSRWRISSIPQEVSQAVESGWFPAGASVLDLGCGAGEIAAWLSDRGFKVLGVDFAIAAIEKAKRECEGSGGDLQFQTLDVCGDIPPLIRPSVLIDRGCLHGIRPAAIPRYIRNVTAWCDPGTRYLLFVRIADRGELGKSFDAVVRNVTTALGHSFAISRTGKTYLVQSESGGKSVPGVVFWMVRREVAPGE